MVVAMVSLVELSHTVALLDDAASPALVARGLREAGLGRRMLRGEAGCLPCALEAIVVEQVARALGDPSLGGACD